MINWLFSPTKKGIVYDKVKESIRAYTQRNCQEHEEKSGVGLKCARNSILLSRPLFYLAQALLNTFSVYCLYISPENFLKSFIYLFFFRAEEERDGAFVSVDLLLA